MFGKYLSIQTRRKSHQVKLILIFLQGKFYQVYLDKSFFIYFYIQVHENLNRIQHTKKEAKQRPVNLCVDYNDSGHKIPSILLLLIQRENLYIKCGDKIFILLLLLDISESMYTNTCPHTLIDIHFHYLQA